MKILLIIIGYYIGIITMCLFINNKQKEREQEISNNYIHKNKIYKRIQELELNSKCTLDVKIHTLSDSIEYAIKELEKLL